MDPVAPNTPPTTPPTPSASPVVPPSKPKNRIVLLIVGILILGLGFTIGLFFNNNLSLTSQISPTPTQSPTAIIDPTANWKTYTNSVHRISFKYPPTWQIDNHTDQDPLNAQVTLSKDQAKIKMYFNLNGIGGLGQTYQGRPFELDGNNLYRFVKTNNNDGTQMVGISTSLINTLGVFEVNGKTYSITLGYPISDVQTEKGNLLEKEFDQILSTFKFVDAPQMVTVSGKLCYPSDFLPAGEIVAKDITSGKTYTQPYAGGIQTFNFPLPSGKYHLRYQAHASANKPDVFISGYYTPCATNPDNTFCQNPVNQVQYIIDTNNPATVNNVQLCDFYSKIDSQF